MNTPAKTYRLEEAHRAYLERRAQDKYDGKVEALFPLEEFRKCADYLAGVLQNATLDEEDIGDVVRVALSRRGKAAGA
ncbi:MAG TPA: hypothetical protein VLM38_07280 [Blastocatellia bacterium]|nr:hypothetical protein [Blastocatellia bacterium]